MDRTLRNGALSMIVQPTWLVNYTFGDLRNYILSNFHIDSLLHMGRGNFGNDWGSIAFSFIRNKINRDSLFFKLYERAFYKIEPEHISSLFISSMKDPSFKYKFSSYNSEAFSKGYIVNLYFSLLTYYL